MSSNVLAFRMASSLVWGISIATSLEIEGSRDFKNKSKINLGSTSILQMERC